MAAQATFRITKELKEFQDRPDTNLFIHYDEADVMKFNALLVGPEATPYEYGMFEFLLKFPNDYPSKAPHVVALTTDKGRTRFNPNIYATGKVCLSILGTWPGKPGEEWRSSQGFQSVLISILSLMNEDPYKNEPGYEDYDKPANNPPTPVATPPTGTNATPPTTGTGGLSSALPVFFAPHRTIGTEKEAKLYIRKIRHETIRISVIQRLEEYLNIDQPVPTNIDGATAAANSDDDDDDDGVTRRPASPGPLELGMWHDRCKHLFLWYYDIYMETINRERSEVQEGEQFCCMPFESGGNAMRGKFMYKDLETRLRRIREAIEQETQTWVTQGAKAYQTSDRVASNLKSQFDQCQLYFSDSPKGITLTLEMEKDNPFVWTMVYFGRPMTKWDGGLFTLRLIFSPFFPAQQPRVRIVTPFFHANVTKDGIPYYRVARPDSAQAHIEALLDIFEKDMNPDPSCVLDRKCAELYWRRGQEGKKEYAKMIRKVVTRSVEYE